MKAQASEEKQTLSLVLKQRKPELCFYLPFANTP